MLDTTAKLRQNVIADKITMTLRIEFILSSLFPINDPMPFLVRCMTKTAGWSTILQDDRCDIS
jgi:hypothetical protein